MQAIKFDLPEEREEEFVDAFVEAMTEAGFAEGIPSGSQAKALEIAIAVADRLGMAYTIGDGMRN